jgi:hypothetical protein
MRHFFVEQIGDFVEALLFCAANFVTVCRHWNPPSCRWLMDFTHVNRAQPVAAQRRLEQRAEALDCVGAGRCFEDQRKALTAGFSGSLANRIRARVMLKRETTDGPVFAMRAGPFPFSLLICRDLVDGCDFEAVALRGEL